MKLKYIVEEDQILVKESLELKGLSRTIRKKARVQDNIFINGEKAKNYYELHKGDTLELDFFESPNDEIYPSDINLDIRYEDDYFIIINKERGIASQPSRKHLKDNVISGVKSHFIKNNIESNVHLVNRLDLNTSGLMIIAKDGLTHFEFSKVDIKKQYLCLVTGILDNDEGVID